MKKIINSFFIKILVVTAAMFGVGAIHYVCNNESKSQHNWLNQLQDMENNAWQELNKIGITKEGCLALKEQDYAIYQEMHKPVYAPYTKPISEKTRAIVDPVLAAFDLNSKDVPFFQWDKNFVATIDSGIYINEEEFHQCPSLAQQQFVIAHELQHFMQQDHSMRFFIKNQIVAQENESTHGLQLDYDHPYWRYVRFTEIRADILAAIKNEFFAQSYQEFATALYAMPDGNVSHESHPAASDRIAMARNILQTAVVA